MNKYTKVICIVLPMYFVCASCAIKNYIYVFFPWRCGPTYVMAYSFLKFLDDTTTRHRR